MWANWYTTQWDLYIQCNAIATQHPLILSLKDPHVVFKETDQLAYSRFRELMQIIDISVLDARSLQYLPRTIVAASMYIILAYHCGQATKQQLAYDLSKSSQFIDRRFPFNNLYGDFLMANFGFQLEELIPAIQFMSEFMGISFNYNTAAIPNEVIDSSYEEFLSFQTHNPMQLDFVKKRLNG